MFISHAWGNEFVNLVQNLRSHFVSAVASKVFVWLDIFAINQKPGRAMAELQNGKTADKSEHNLKPGLLARQASPLVSLQQRLITPSLLCRKDA